MDTEPWLTGFTLTCLILKPQMEMIRQRGQLPRPIMVIVKFTSNVTYAESNLNGAVLAESDQTEVVEGNHYFPPDTINKEYFQSSQTHDMPVERASVITALRSMGRLIRMPWYYPTAKEKAKTLRVMWRFGEG